MGIHAGAARSTPRRADGGFFRTHGPNRVLARGVLVTVMRVMSARTRLAALVESKRRSLGERQEELEEVRRSAAEVSIETWRRLTSAEREAVQAETISLPLPGLNTPITVHWS